MKRIAMLVFILFCITATYGQSIKREIDVSGSKYEISSKTSLDKMVSLLGKYTSIQKGDQNKENYVWSNGNKAYFEKGELVLLIIRDSGISYKGIMIGDSLNKAIEVLGMHDPKNETVQEGMYKDLYWPAEKIRMDVDRKNEEIKAIFLNMK